ncbi:MAG TPA: prepilin-type N-terminal cleavage/methylation domain-containing protein [Candidatus Binatia bacterium]|jgi:prepilin-type N-terminal cleavage/methylation domain-containing protein|nr:prepilin-type N-terminal cleavage/methylation domain-containing protein [Candidatus Binatia bacterium]
MGKLVGKPAGFSLIELLMVVAIVALLAAIAIPQFIVYRKTGLEAQIKEDLRNAAAAQESYFADRQAYVNGPLSSGTPPGYNRSAPITITAAVSGNIFTLTATHASCSGVSWSFINGQVAGGPCP